MNTQRWITVIVLTTMLLLATVVLTGVHDQLGATGESVDLGALDDAQIARIRAALGPLPEAPCDPSVPGKDLTDERRKTCNRHYLAVVKAARSLGYEGVRIRDVRNPSFHARLNGAP